MKTLLVFLVMLALSMPTHVCVASGGTSENGGESTDLAGGKRTVSARTEAGSVVTSSSKSLKAIARRDEFLPILFNTPGRHGFAPQKSQEPDLPVMRVGASVSQRIRLVPGPLKGPPGMDDADLHQ